MISSQRKQYFSWLTSGLAASSLALIVFIPDLSVSNEWAKWLSVGFFIVTIPFSLTSNLILKELEVFEFEGSKKIADCHHTCLLIALISFFVGFSAFCYSMKSYLMFVFIGSFILAYLIFRSVQREILRS